MLNEMRRRIAPLSIPKRCIAAVIGIAIVLTVIFIFSNSMKPPAESTEDSNAVKDLVAQVIPPESDLGQKIIKNIRKIAHFTEFATLGSLLSWFFGMVKSGRWLFNTLHGWQFLRVSHLYFLRYPKCLL